MSRNGSNIYSKPAGTTAIPGTVVESAKYNELMDDLAADLNIPRPIVAGGTGASTIEAARAALGVAGFKTQALMVADTVLSYSSVAAGDFIMAGGDRYKVAAAGATDQHFTTGGGVKLYHFSTPGTEFADPSTNDIIPMGAIVAVAKASGEKDYYQAGVTFTWVELLSHVFSATPDLVRMRKAPARYGQAPVPTGHTGPADFDIYSAGAGKFVTSLDRKEDYRAQYQPAYTRAYYLDNVNGDDANSGLTLALAKKTFGSVRAAVNANGDGVVYVRHSGKAYDELDGPTHTATITVDWSLFGLPDVHGNGPYLCNAEKKTDFTFTANATYAWVYEATPPSANIGRIHDITKLDTIDTPHGAVAFPTEYEALTSVAAVAAKAGSYWNDTSGNKLYVHLIGAAVPDVSTNIVIPRSDIGIVTGSITSKQFYAEGVTFMSDLSHEGTAGKAYYSECVSVGSRAAGFSTGGSEDFGTRNCITVDSFSDGFNYHNFGAVITAITRANPAVVSAASANFVNGQVITIENAAGMTEINGGTYTVANVVAGVSFELSGVNSTGYTAYTGTAGRARLSTSTYHAINPTVLHAGTSDGSNQCSSAHENVQGWTINPYFVGAFRDTVVDIETSKHVICGGYLGTTRIPATAGTDNRAVLITDNADTALFGVEWGGYFDPVRIFETSGSGVIRVLDTDLPYDATRWNGVTAEWQ